MSKFTRMAISEARDPLSRVQVVEKMRLYGDALRDLAKDEPNGYLGHRILSEDAGNLVVLELDFANRESCMRHHISQEYKAFIRDTMNYLAGEYVTKICKNE